MPGNLRMTPKTSATVAAPAISEKALPKKKTQILSSAAARASASQPAPRSTWRKSEYPSTRPSNEL